MSMGSALKITNIMAPAKVKQKILRFGPKIRAHSNYSVHMSQPLMDEYVIISNTANKKL